MALWVIAWDDVNERLKRTTKDPADIIPGAASSGIEPDTVKKGTVNATNGSTQATVTFTTAFTSNSYAVIVQWVNTVDGSPLIEPLKITNKTAAGFTIKWNQPTDSVNYYVDFLAVQPCSLYKANAVALTAGSTSYTDSLLSASSLPIVASLEETSFNTGPILFQPLIISDKTTTNFYTEWAVGITDTNGEKLHWMALDASCVALKSGVQAIGSGSTQVSPSLTFPDLTSSTYSVVTLLTNMIDATVLIIPTIITAKSISTFTAKFSMPVDSDNYRLEWILNVY